jgi:acyl carrier protein
VDEITEAVLDYVVDEYVEDDDDLEIDPDTPLITSGIVDSFSMVSLKAFLEKTYSITLPDTEATPETFNTVSSIVALVKKHQAA